MGWYQKILGEQNVIRDRSYTRWNDLNEEALLEEKKKETMRIVEKDKAQPAKPKTAGR